MPPKGRGKSKRTGSSDNEANGDGENKTTPKPGNLNGKPETPEGTNDDEPSLNEGEESEDSNFNEEDNFQMLKKILLKQKLSEKKSDERFNKLTKSIKDLKKSFYKEANDKTVSKIKTEMGTVVKDLKKLQTQVQDLKTELTEANEKLDTTLKQLNETRTNLNEQTKTVEKLDKKFEKDEDELKRCLLLIDGVNEHGNKKTLTVVENLMKDLGLKYKEGDVKMAYRLGPLKTGIARPRTIKVQFNSTHHKGDIFKNIGKLKSNQNWKGTHLSDALSPPRPTTNEGPEVCICGR